MPCFPCLLKRRQPLAKPSPPSSPPTATTTMTDSYKRKAVIYIIFYSMYTHVYQLAKELAKAVNETGLAEAKLFQVPETLADNVLELMHAPSKPEDVPMITANQLADADGFLLGAPTRFGVVASQMRSFWETTGALWAQGKLRGKLAGTFFSTGSQNGGQETTALTLLPTLAHHGIVYVPTGFTTAHLSQAEEVVGGSAYGAGTHAPPGKDGLTKKEKEIAAEQGKLFAKTVAAQVWGNQLLAQK
ncbi:hypothetical protein H4R34_005166 [Dimargaris verticillata]|uniref:Flavodoxin-like domain-containing protein n=1 Tax=Dimargaris verticillata TaxID=2761393 RepID=A0A9W8AYQ5_9FUNG|nr:hypothetical protein H4R34_005166 [Dimargaris verticillata]